MKKLLTYVLWEGPDIHNQMSRLYRPKERYWYNIPYLLVANSCLFPDFHIRFYIYKDSSKHPFFVFLEETSKKFEKVELEVLDIPYKGTQLTVQRMKPLWEADVEYLFCRDIDYAIYSLERKCMDHFMEQDRCLIHGIRSYRTHHLMPIFAGLCGFNVKEISKKVKSLAPTFEDYVEFSNRTTHSKFNYKNGEWGCDQLILMDFFYQAGLYSSILDCPIRDAGRLRKDLSLNVEYFDSFSSMVPCSLQEYNRRDLKYCNVEIIEYLDVLFNDPVPMWKDFPPFLGRAWTCPSAQLKKLIHLADNEMSKAVEKIFVDNFKEISYKIKCSNVWGIR